jgi:AraC-like DNA-binding protein
VKPRRFFAYFPTSALAQKWELYATSFGHVQMEEKAAKYPPDRHPAGHHFVWEEGRVLADCQLLCIHAGRGEFESATSRRVRLQAGTTVILHPGVWHRYRPDPGTGWTESWLELRGPHLDRLLKNGIIDPRKAAFHRPSDTELEAIWERARQTAWAKPPQFTVRLGIIGLEILAKLQEKARPPRVPRRIEDIVSQAQTLLSEIGADETTIEQMAAQLGVGYSHFRRAFKSQTGFSPKQYHNEVRFRRTKELLSQTALSIKEIASRLGYSSPYHLTKDFTQRTQVAPSLWRAALERSR